MEESLEIRDFEDQVRHSEPLVRTHKFFSEISNRTLCWEPPEPSKGLSSVGMNKPWNISGSGFSILFNFSLKFCSTGRIIGVMLRDWQEHGASRFLELIPEIPLLLPHSRSAFVRRIVNWRANRFSHVTDKFHDRICTARLMKHLASGNYGCDLAYGQCSNEIIRISQRTNNVPNSFVSNFTNEVLFWLLFRSEGGAEACRASRNS